MGDPRGPCPKAGEQDPATSDPSRNAKCRGDMESSSALDRGDWNRVCYGADALWGKRSGTTAFRLGSLPGLKRNGAPNLDGAVTPGQGYRLAVRCEGNRQDPADLTGTGGRFLDASQFP